MLSEKNATFIQRHTSMSVGARDAQNRPAVGRALGCRVSADLRSITIFLSASRAAPLLDCLRHDGAIALAVTRPRTHETLQFKGTVRSIKPASAADLETMAAFCETFVEELVSIGFASELARGILAGAEDALAVTFEPTAVFDQTPGPKAGAKLDSAR